MKALNTKAFIFLVFAGMLLCSCSKPAHKPAPYEGIYRDLNGFSIQITGRNFSYGSPNGDATTGTVEEDGTFLLFYFKTGDRWQVRVYPDRIKAVEIDGRIASMEFFRKSN